MIDAGAKDFGGWYANVPMALGMRLHGPTTEKAQNGCLGKFLTPVPNKAKQFLLDPSAHGHRPTPHRSRKVTTAKKHRTTVRA